MMPVTDISEKAQTDGDGVQRLLRSVSREDWDERLELFADANFYQTSAYGAVSWGEEKVERWRLISGDTTVALAQLRVVRVPMLKAGVAYLRWGPCCQRRGTEWSVDIFKGMIQALEEEYVERRGLMFRLIPAGFTAEEISQSTIDILRAKEFVREEGVAAYRTIRVDLTAELDVIRKRFHGKWRNMLNGAERNDLTVIEGTNDSLYAQFISLYDEMMSRKKFDTSVDVDAFRQIQNELPESQKMIIMISLKEGVPQTGLISTGVGDSGIYLLGATSDQGMKSKASYLLQWRMMNRLRERGCQWYDLGGINPETNPGVYHFKNGMGGEEVSQPGRFERSRSGLSGWIVRSGERLKSGVKRFRS